MSVICGNALPCIIVTFRACGITAINFVATYPHVNCIVHQGDTVVAIGEDEEEGERES